MANISACLSSKTDNWATPQVFFDKLNKEFHFTLDPCADVKTALVLLLHGLKTHLTQIGLKTYLK